MRDLVDWPAPEATVPEDTTPERFPTACKLVVILLVAAALAMPWLAAEDTIEQIAWGPSPTLELSD